MTDGLCNCKFCSDVRRRKVVKDIDLYDISD